jgi:hypothetical protein
LRIWRERIAAASLVLQAGILLYTFWPRFRVDAAAVLGIGSICQAAGGCQEAGWSDPTAIVVILVSLFLLGLGFWVRRRSRAAHVVGIVVEGLLGALGLYLTATFSMWTYSVPNLATPYFLAIGLW